MKSRSHFGWKRFKTSGRSAHAECIDSYNSTIQCGADHGSCSDRACMFSDNYDENLSQIAAEKRKASRFLRESLTDPKTPVELSCWDLAGNHQFSDVTTLDKALSTYGDVEGEWHVPRYEDRGESYWKAWREQRVDSEGESHPVGYYTLEVK
jgi:hypothetical protein